MQRLADLGHEKEKLVDEGYHILDMFYSFSELINLAFIRQKLADLGHEK